MNIETRKMMEPDAKQVELWTASIFGGIKDNPTQDPSDAHDVREVVTQFILLPKANNEDV